MTTTRRAQQGLTAAGAFGRGVWLDSRHAAATRFARAVGRDPGDGAPDAPDPFSSEVLGGQEHWIGELHAAGPVSYSRKRDIWIINGYDEVRAAGRAHDVLISGEGTAKFRARLPMLVTMDRPDHARLRRILARDFTKARATEFTALVRSLMDEAIERIIAAPGTDAYPALAAPVPLDVIAGILGVPPERRDDLRRWSDSTVAMTMTDLTPGGLTTLGRFLKDAADLFDYFEGVIEDRRSVPGEDALSRLVSYDDEQGPLTTEELLWFTLMLLVAGNETTTSVTMALLLNLAVEPEQYALLRSEPERIPAAVEEAVRWATPVTAFFRTAREDYPIGDVTIPVDGRVMLHFAAANRDPRRWPDPDQFDLRREPHDHIGFGSGIHFCLGSHLARVELCGLLEALVERVERIELTGTPVWRQNALMRGVESLPLRFCPAN